MSYGAGEEEVVAGFVGRLAQRASGLRAIRDNISFFQILLHWHTVVSYSPGCDNDFWRDDIHPNIPEELVAVVYGFILQALLKKHFKESFSHSNGSLRQSRFHFHMPSTQTPQSAMSIPLWLDILYSLVNLPFKAPLPPQLSSQRRIFSSFPSFCNSPSENQKF
ncbi:hypothetical protein RJT34_25538 [Clitoria ternatea]|uniref:Uncharacterized protein n=1 Tax=Clitoria ternatea TaxID=43366 RepID=A0AAN9FS79_CLITE